MSLYAIGDTHLSFGCCKPMNIFEGWHCYEERLERSWREQVSEEDTVLLAGDISWGMNFEEALPDFRFLHSLPGKKVIIKGNHDYWWTTRSKMDAFFAQNGLDSLVILHNNCVLTEDFALCGTRGWLFEKGQPQDKKVLAREAGRLERSLQSARDSGRETLVFLHYPPLYGEEASAPILDVLLRYGVKRVYYGHIHGAGRAWALNGECMGIRFRLISADQLGFCPELIEPSGQSFGQPGGF